MHDVCLILPKTCILQSALFCTGCNRFLSCFILRNGNIKLRSHNPVIFVCNRHLVCTVDIKALFQCICDTEFLHSISLGIYICTNQEIKLVILMNTKGRFRISTSLCIFPVHVFISNSFFHLRFFHGLIAKTGPDCFCIFCYRSHI